MKNNINIGQKFVYLGKNFVVKKSDGDLHTCMELREPNTENIYNEDKEEIPLQDGPNTFIRLSSEELFPLIKNTA